MTPPQLEKADAKETLLISPAWKPVMSSEQNSKRAHLLVSPKLERAESQERCLGANLLACLQHRRKSEPWRKPGVLCLCLRAEKAGECHEELKGDTAYGTGERFVTCKYSGRTPVYCIIHIQCCRSLCSSMDGMQKNMLPWHIVPAVRETAGCKAFLPTGR